MSDIKNKEKDKIKLKKIIFISFIVTFSILLVLVVLLVVFYGKYNSVPSKISNVYNFSGNILNTQSIYSDILLVTEENVVQNKNQIEALTLKNNQLLSRIVLCENVDIKNINDFGVVIKDYDKDGCKDFSYINSKEDGKYEYYIYSVDKNGIITKKDVQGIKATTNRASISLVKTDNGYEYVKAYFYYDDYLVPSEIGKYKLDKKEINENALKISSTSKISITKGYNAIPREYSVLDDIPESILNINSYLLESSNKQYIDIDLDNDRQSEYIVLFSVGDTYNIILLDNLGNYLTTLISRDRPLSLKENIELADIDNDNIMEIIVIDNKELEVHKFNCGYYY